jgi:hypothetical protein
MTTVALQHGDPLMRRLATETMRLRIHRDAIDALISDHTDQLLAGLHERSTKAGPCTRLELDGLIIRRNGPTGIDILTTGRR